MAAEAQATASARRLGQGHPGFGWRAIRIRCHHGATYFHHLMQVSLRFLYLPPIMQGTRRIVQGNGRS